MLATAIYSSLLNLYLSGIKNLGLTSTTKLLTSAMTGYRCCKVYPDVRSNSRLQVYCVFKTCEAMTKDAAASSEGLHLSRE